MQSGRGVASLRSIATLVAALMGTAHADPTRTDPSEHITVFTDGPQIVTLVGPPMTAPINRVINRKENGKARARNLGTASALLGLGLKRYWVRVRVIDGVMTCEKFGFRSNDPAEAEAWAKELFAESCS